MNIHFSTETPKVLGVYIGDDSIDAVCGIDPHWGRGVTENWDPQVDLGITTDSSNIQVFVPVQIINGDIQFALSCLAQQILENCPVLHAICIGCYGPFVSSKLDSIRYGEVRDLDRHRSFEGLNLVELLRSTLRDVGLRIPAQITVETDVACAALGEKYLKWAEKNGGYWESGKRDSVVAFIKASLWIGGAFTELVEPFKGRLHSEMGQLRVPLWADSDLDPLNEEMDFNREHDLNNRLEGLANVSGIESRFKDTFASLTRQTNHPAWEREAHYLAHMCHAVTVICAPDNIVLGGRIMIVGGLLRRIRLKFRMLSDNPPYARYPEMLKDDYIRLVSKSPKRPELLGKPGVLGSLLLACKRSRLPLRDD